MDTLKITTTIEAPKGNMIPPEVAEVLIARIDSMLSDLCKEYEELEDGTAFYDYSLKTRRKDRR